MLQCLGQSCKLLVYSTDIYTELCFCWYFSHCYTLFYTKLWWGVLRSARGWLLKICHTEGPHTLGEMVSHAGNPHIPLILVSHTDCPHIPWKTVSHTGCPHFHQGIPIFPGKWGLQVPILPVIWGPHFHTTQVWNGYVILLNIHKTF